MKITFLLIASSLLIGCQTSYEMTLADDPQTGEILVDISSVMQRMNVAIDGQYHFRESRAKQVTISGVEPGERIVRVVASDDQRVRSIDQQETVHVQPGQTQHIVIPAPPYGAGFYIMNGIFMAGSVALYYALK